MKELYAKSMFCDSGAHSLYNLHVLKLKDRAGKHGRELARLPVRWSQGDFSYYDLRKGTEFRKYCDTYAKFIKRMEGTGIICANVDAISNPDLTWEIQKFFEREHGVCPVPIVHYGTPLSYVDRYLEDPQYSLLGVGGLGQGVTRHEYIGWGDTFFLHICPEQNHRLPVIRTHGFAMTSWELICRWPWFSVDSATWIKLAAYGWVYVPRWSRESKEWNFNVPPLVINFSWRSPQRAKRQTHYQNISRSAKENADRWLEYLGLKLGSVDSEGNEVEFGVVSHFRARSIANLRYLKGLEQSRPAWPHPLDDCIVDPRTWEFHRGMGY